MPEVAAPQEPPADYRGRSLGGHRAAWIFAVLVPLAAGPAAASVITVDSLGDDLDENGNCTLREAVEAANTDVAVDACPAGSDAEADEIALPVGTFGLSLEGAEEDENQTGDLDVDGAVVIRGVGPLLTTIDAGGIDRGIHVLAGAEVTLRGLTVANGQTPAVVVTDPSSLVDTAEIFALTAGGGVLSRGSLTIERCRLVDNATGDGTQVAFGGDLIGLPGGSGGGVAAIGGDVTIVESTIAGNETGDGAPSTGGLPVDLGFGGFGGGVGVIDGTLVLERSTVAGNRSGTGAIVDGPLAPFQAGGGGVALFGFLPLGSSTIDRSTISGNEATDGKGGGVFTVTDSLTLIETTITGNSATEGGGTYTGGATLESVGSLITGNTADTGPDCTPLLGGDHNLVADATDCDVGGDNSLVGANANLGELANHGGLTQTHALLAGSDAIDAGPPTCGAVDQRGFARPQGDGCDIGAFEFSDCGNGAVDAGEDCDDAGDSATCNVDCTFVECGDGYANAAAGEECDTGGTLSDTEPNACRLSCVLPGCGDGVVDAGEACDLGGDAEACDGDCSEVSCGDGYPNDAVGEECDTGELLSDTEPDACRLTCLLPSCGDDVIDGGEECDDGVLNDDATVDACRTTCLVAFCGDGVVDTVEGCDNGESNSDVDADACRTTCTPASCGDAVTDSGEECDDGAENSDVAASACRTSCIAATCGDGTIDVGESCDDGDDVSGDGCSDACAVESGWACVLELDGSACTFLADCGNGVLDDSEACDDGNQSDDDGCSGSCGLEDGFECTTDDDGAIEACEPIVGDGLVVGDEQCDDGNEDAGDGCFDGLIEAEWACNAAEPSVCTPLVDCGDGTLAGGEDCEDGNADDGDGCSATCDVEDGWVCDTSTEPTVCAELDGDVGPADGGDGTSTSADSGCCAVAASRSTGPSSTLWWLLAALGALGLRRRGRGRSELGMAATNCLRGG